MRKGWAVGVCVLALGLLAVAGCATRIPVYSDAKDLECTKQYEEAIAKYKEYMDQNKDSDLVPYAAYHVALCYIQMGDKDKATKELNGIVKVYAQHKVVQDKPDNNPVKWAQDDLKALKETPEKILPPKPAEPAAPSVK